MTNGFRARTSFGRSRVSVPHCSYSLGLGRMTPRVISHSGPYLNPEESYVDPVHIFFISLSGLLVSKGSSEKTRPVKSTFVCTYIVTLGSLEPHDKVCQLLGSPFFFLWGL